MKQYTTSLNNDENALAQRFREFIDPIENLPRHLFIASLLEKRALSRSFVPLYKAGLGCIKDFGLHKIVEDIITDEFQPANHQMLLDNDLERMGIYIPEHQYSYSAITRTTVKQVRTAFDGLTTDLERGFFLRMYGELLPGIEYDVLWPRLERDFGLTDTTSQFYWHHKVHDKKRVGLGESGDTHTDSFGGALMGLVRTADDVVVAQGAMKRGYELRMEFWKQFLGC